MIRITLACAAGMSTSLLVAKMNVAAIKLDVTAKIRAVPEAGVKDVIEETDVLLLGPQIGYTLSRMKSDYGPKGVKVTVIDSVDYGMMNGEKVLKMALGL